MIYYATKKKQIVEHRNMVTNSNSRKKYEQEMKDELAQDILNNFKITITTSITSKSDYDDSIIDVTDQSYKINLTSNLVKYSSGVPYWAHRYIFSSSDLNNASVQQKEFYGVFKTNFLNGEYINLEENTNYAFILLFDLLNEYDSHKDISKLEHQLKILGHNYPITKSYGMTFLIEKMESDGYSADVSRLKEENRYGYQNYNSNFWYIYYALL